MYYIGIDGGGTKTSFTLINEQGLKIGQYKTGTTHYAQIGFDECIFRLTRIWRSKKCKT